MFFCSKIMLNLLFLLLVLFIIYCIVFIMKLRSKNSLKKKSCKTLIVIGSGGHTLEMMKHVRTLNPSLYSPRMYVMASVDRSSEHKIKELEGDFQIVSETSYEILKIPRSRLVNQSYFTSVFTTLYSFLYCFPIVFKYKPDLVLCNGPGTCIPVCVIAFLMKTFFFFNTKIVFVESICRVKTLSLSGKILLYIADVVIVQWENLHKKYPQTTFLGRLT